MKGSHGQAHFWPLAPGLAANSPQTSQTGIFVSPGPNEVGQSEIGHGEQ